MQICPRSRRSLWGHKAGGHRLGWGLNGGSGLPAPESAAQAAGGNQGIMSLGKPNQAPQMQAPGTRGDSPATKQVQWTSASGKRRSPRPPSTALLQTLMSRHTRSTSREVELHICTRPKEPNTWGPQGIPSYTHVCPTGQPRVPCST